MEKCGINSILDNPYLTIKIQKCPPSVEIYDEGNIPREYIRSKTVESVDKIKILNSLKDGDEVAGARISQKNALIVK